jgi:hypothetical protein
VALEVLPSLLLRRLGICGGEIVPSQCGTGEVDFESNVLRHEAHIPAEIEKAASARGVN